MSEPERHIRRVVENPAPIEPGLRVNSRDYGTGTVVAIVATGIQVFWDEPLLGTSQHLLVHDKAFVMELDRI